MKTKRLKIEAPPPSFVLWGERPEISGQSWKRQWFGHELCPESLFNVRGIGIREPMFNPNVHRPLGTGDWLIMFFHQPPRLKRANPLPSHPGCTIVIWPPGAEQFYSWGDCANTEPHSWMHVEGMLVAQQIESMQLPVNTPLALPDETVMLSALEGLFDEMRHALQADGVILQNIFENWARAIHRQIQHQNPTSFIPPGLLRVRQKLDENFRRIPPLEELTVVAAMSRSHLCHRFRQHFGSTISEYVIRKRMAAGQRLLYERSLRPGEIADAVGYPDIYQFSKQFKKTFGVSPSHYRKRYASAQER